MLSGSRCVQIKRVKKIEGVSLLRHPSTCSDAVIECLVWSEVLRLRVVGTARCMTDTRLGHLHGFCVGKDRSTRQQNGAD